jgi:hypothetical protein
MNADEKEAFVKGPESKKYKETGVKNGKEKSIQADFVENYDLKLALSLSKTEAEAKKKVVKQHTGFARILPPEEAFEVIKDRLNLIYHK